MKTNGFSRLLFTLIVSFFLFGSLSAQEKKPENPGNDTVKEKREKPDRPFPEKPESETGEDKNPVVEIKTDYQELLSTLGDSEEENIEVYYHHCNYISGTELKKILENFITAAGTIASSEESELVIVSDVKSNIKNLKRIARESDQFVPQILVQAQIVELQIDNDFEKELNLAYEVVDEDNQSFIQNIMTQLATPGATSSSLYTPLDPDNSSTAGQGSYMNIRPYTSTSGGTTKTLSTFLRFLETRGKAKLLSSPNLILSRGIEGSIITGEDLPISESNSTSSTTSVSIKYKRVGVKLRVKPIKIIGDTVKLMVNPDVSLVTRYETINSVETPVIAVRNATTELEVKDGELLSIGGLLSSEESEIIRRMPVLSTIPVVGPFFRSTRKTTVKKQLVIFLTIKILKDSQPGGTMIYNQDKMQERLKENVSVMEEKFFKRQKPTFGRDFNLLIDRNPKQEVEIPGLVSEDPSLQPEAELLNQTKE